MIFFRNPYQIFLIQASGKTNFYIAGDFNLNLLEHESNQCDLKDDGRSNVVLCLFFFMSYSDMLLCYYHKNLLYAFFLFMKVFFFIGPVG